MLICTPLYRVLQKVTTWGTWDGTNDQSFTFVSGTDGVFGQSMYNITSDWLTTIGTSVGSVGVALVGGIGGSLTRDILQLVEVTRTSNGRVSLRKNTTASYRAALNQSYVGWDCNAVCGLNSTQAVTAVCTGTAGRCYVTLWTCNASTLATTPINEVLFTAERAGQVRLDRINDTTFIVTYLTYTAGNQALYAVKCTVSGGVITVGSPITIAAASLGPYKFDTVYVPAANRLFVAYGTYNSGVGYIRVSSIITTTLLAASLELTTSVGSSSVDYVGATSDGSVMMCTYTANNELKLAKLTHGYSGVSWAGQITASSFGTIKQFSPYQGYQYNGVAIMDSDTALVMFENAASDWKATTTPMLISSTPPEPYLSNNTIVWGTSTLSSYDNRTGLIDLLKMSANEAMVFYQDASYIPKMRVMWNGV